MPEANRAGYVFAGWFTAAEGGEPVTAESTVTVDDTRTLYAQWTAGKQTVTFVPCGGECAVESLEYTVDGLYGDLPEANRAGYVFAGWFTAAEGGEPVTAESTVTVDDTRTLYAQWTETPLAELSFFTPDGWPTSAFLAATPGGTNAATCFVLGNPVYLHFSYANSGKAAAGEHLAKVAVSDAFDNEISYWYWLQEELAPNDHLSVTNDNIRVDTETNVTLTVAGSYKVTVVLDAEGDVEESDESNNAITLGFTVVHPIQKVTFDPTGGTCVTETETYTIGGTYGTMPTATRAGYDFDGWWTAATGGLQITGFSTDTTDATRILYAHWTAGTQTVTFSVYPEGSGSCSPSNHTYTMGLPYGWLPTPTLAAGWMGVNKFGGWYTEAYGGELITTNSIVGTNAAMTLYAEWVAVPDLCFENQPFFAIGAASTNAVTNFSLSDPVYLHTEHWNVGLSSTGEHVVRVSVWNSAEEVATWDWIAGDLAPWDWMSWETNADFMALAGIGEAGNYTLTVTLDPDDEVNEVDETNNSCILPFTVTASKKQTVTFDANGGTSAMQTQTYTVGGTYGPFPSVSWSGHAFAGWFTEKGGGTEVAEGTIVTAESERTLYAHWRDDVDGNTVRFAFGTDGGTQTLVLGGGNSTSQSNPLAWVESSLQVALAGGARTTTLTVACAANSGAKRMGSLTVTVDGTVYTVEVVQDGGFGVAECAVDSDAGLFRIQWVGDSGKTYTLQRAPSPDGPWTAAGSVAASADGIVSLDAAMPGKWMSGFYRLATTE